MSTALDVESARISNPGHELSYSFDEDELVHLGYALVEDGHHEKAAAVFKIAVHKFPDAYNAHDSYVEAWALLGKFDRAIKHYQRSLEIEPGNDHVRQMIKLIEAKQAERAVSP